MGNQLLAFLQLLAIAGITVDADMMAIAFDIRIPIVAIIGTTTLDNDK